MSTLYMPEEKYRGSPMSQKLMLLIGHAEVRWTRLGETITHEGHTNRQCGEDEKHQYGEASLARKEVVGSISCSPISSRLMSIRILARPHSITVIQVYATISDHEEQFYLQLNSSIAKTPKKDVHIVQGDWNAKVCPDAHQHWSGTVGRFGFGETNGRGWRLLEFGKSHRLTLSNTRHPHKLSIGQQPGMPLMGRVTTRRTLS